MKLAKIVKTYDLRQNSKVVGCAQSSLELLQEFTSYIIINESVANNQ